MAKNQLYKITILNWLKHNANHKDSFRYTKIANNFCHDGKLSVLPLSHRWLLLGLLLTCGSESSDTVVMSERQLRDLLESSKSVSSALSSLESLQVLRAEKIPEIHSISNSIKSLNPSIKDRECAPRPEPQLTLEPSEPDTPKKQALHWLAALWNDTVTSLPKIKAASGKRLASIERRAKELPDREQWFQIFAKVEASDFLSGRNGRWTACDFDWILGNSKSGSPNYVRVDEGVHDNKGGIGANRDISPEYRTKSSDFDFLKDMKLPDFPAEVDGE